MRGYINNITVTAKALNPAKTPKILVASYRQTAKFGVLADFGVLAVRDVEEMRKVLI